MSIKALPNISQRDIDANSQASAVIHLPVSRYHDIIVADTSGQIQNEFTAEQNILMAFEVLDGQVCNGGFIQLIENGYGSYIFDTPFSQYLKEWGLDKTVSLIDQARPIYHSKREIIEREKTLEEFAKLYQEHPEFDPLDKEFHEVIAAERDLVKEYILKHIDRFAIIS